MMFNIGKGNNNKIKGNIYSKFEIEVKEKKMQKILYVEDI